MTEPTSDQPTSDHPTSDHPTEPKPPNRTLTIGLAVALVAAVAVGVVALALPRGGPGKTVDTASKSGAVNPGADPQGTPVPSASNGPARPRDKAQPPRPGKQGDVAASKKHRRTSTAVPLAPHAGGGAGASQAIVSYQSGRCVDAANGSGAALRIWDCDGAARQRWIFASDGTVRSLGLCMTLGGGSSADGTPVQLAHCTGGASQRFVLNSSLDLVNIAADKCVDVTDQRTTDGARLQLWQCAGTSNQKWHT